MTFAGRLYGRQETSHKNEIDDGKDLVMTTTVCRLLVKTGHGPEEEWRAGRDVHPKLIDSHRNATVATT